MGLVGFTIHSSVALASSCAVVTKPAVIHMYGTYMLDYVCASVNEHTKKSAVRTGLGGALVLLVLRVRGPGLPLPVVHPCVHIDRESTE